MAQSQSKRTYDIVLGILALMTTGVLVCMVAVLVANRPPSSKALAATLTAMPSPVPTSTATPTPVPTPAGSDVDLLVCQSKAVRAMSARSMVGAVNISSDHSLRLAWFSLDWKVDSLDDALSGVIMGCDVALDVWQGGCAVYDRVQISIYEGQGDQQVHKLDVQAQMDDLLQWRADQLSDRALIDKLQVTTP